jgi:phospholipid/cholesterol/gamma-HCH transport system substrate-binding protein
MWPSTGRETRVGLLIASGVAVLVVAVLLIGRESNLFTRKARYMVRFPNAQGLNPGSPVQLNGVKVGSVEHVDLPEALDEHRVTVRLAIDNHFAGRVRGDSVARIKTLGLLGDRYIELTSGSSDFPPTPPGGEIPAATATDLDKLIASGESVVENVVGISHSLNSLLERLERGEGLLGELTTNSEAGQQLRDSAIAALHSVDTLAKDVQHGDGALGRLISDQKLGNDLATAIGRVSSVFAKAESGKGLLPALLDDAATRQRFDDILASANQAIGELSAVAHDLRTGNGLLPKLLHDERYGQEVTTELHDLLRKLQTLADKLNEGPGTVSRLINDPSLYEAAEDIAVGVNDSKLLRWLIRNRQKQGIQSRYEAERTRQGLPITAPPGEDVAPVASPPAGHLPGERR